MAAPRTMRSVWPEMPFMRGPVGSARLRQWLGESRRVHDAALARRARVLAHPWAAKQLCQIFGYSKAEHWNGFVPPARGPDGELNTSAPRRALMDLLHEVEEADAAIAAVEAAAQPAGEVS